MTNGQQISQKDEDGRTQDGGRHSGDAERRENRRSWLRLGMLCYFLALPLLALELSSDIGFGRDSCDPRPVSSLGTIFDYSGYPLCQIQIGHVLLLWTVAAAMVSPLPILVRILYGRMRKKKVIPLEAERSQKSHSLFWFGLSTIFYTLLAGIAIYVVYWEVTIVLASLAVGYPTGSNCLCAGIDLGNYSGKSNSDGIPVCCTLYIDQALYLLALYSLLVLPVIALARYMSLRWRRTGC